ncbi:transposase, partial [Paraburkholderia sp. GAS334]|uniref:transposase n=1 Tax=Paraburkholderia sp. GAS334 TaxID=3035131 RepID=UPI003D1A64D4
MRGTDTFNPPPASADPRHACFEEWFATEDDCLQYIERLRWRDGFECPRCGYR